MRNVSNRRELSGLIALIAILIVCPFASAKAVPLDEATSVRSSFEFPLGDVDKSSYDGSGFNAFKPFSSIVGSDLLSVSSFTGQEFGSHLDFFLLSESAYFDGLGDPNISNKFGVLDSQGNFSTVIDSSTANPGAVGSLDQGEAQEFTFALNSPEGLFSAIDADNPDDKAHILAMEVTKAGTVFVDPTSLRGSPPIAFDLQVGDIILFIEDMLASGNERFLGVPFDSDFDYNDFVVVVRQSQVPEPSTMLLFGSAIVGLLHRRSRAGR